MKKEDVVWHEEDESVVMEDADGWKLICMMNHFKGKFHYEIKTPDNYYLNYMNKNIYETIERLNQEKEISAALLRRGGEPIMTKEEWNNKSLEWKKGWRAGVMGEDLSMSKKEIESMPDDWKDGVRFAISCFFGGLKPM